MEIGDFDGFAEESTRRVPLASPPHAGVGAGRPRDRQAVAGCSRTHPAWKGSAPDEQNPVCAPTRT